MKGMKVGLVLFVLLLLTSITSAIPVPGQSTAPDQSVPYLIAQKANITVHDTAVLLVGDYSDFALKTFAGIVAYKEKAPVLLTPPNKLDVKVIEALSMLMRYGGLDNVVVIGTSPNTTEIADLVSLIHDPETNSQLTVSVISSDSIDTLSRKVVFYYWENASNLVIADCSLQKDVLMGLVLSSNLSYPVVCEQLGAASIETVADYLGTKDLLATPAVDPDLINQLELDHYNVSQYSSYETIEVVNVSTNNVVFVTVMDGDSNPYDNLIDALLFLGASNDAKIVVAENSTVLGTNQSAFMANLTNPLVIIVGDIDTIKEPVATTIASLTGVSPIRIVFDNNIEKFIELTLATDNYVYPLIVPYYEENNGTYTYDFKNLGFSDAIVYSGSSVRVEFTKESGNFVNSSLTPYMQNETKVIYKIPDPIYPTSSYRLTFKVTPGTKFDAIPKLSYFGYTVAGTVKPFESITSYLINYFTTTFNWFVNMFNKIVGTFAQYFEIVLPHPVAVALAIAIVFLVLWSLVGAAAYVIIKYIMKKPVGNKMWYGIIVWFVR